MVGVIVVDGEGEAEGLPWAWRLQDEGAPGDGGQVAGGGSLAGGVDLRVGEEALSIATAHPNKDDAGGVVR